MLDYRWALGPGFGDLVVSGGAGSGFGRSQASLVTVIMFDHVIVLCLIQHMTRHVIGHVSGHVLGHVAQKGVGGHVRASQDHVVG